MATTCRHSSLLTFLYPPRCFTIQSRSLSCSSRRAMPTYTLPQKKMPAQKAQKVVMQEQMKKGGIPNDLGLLPDTFIMPKGSNRPSWFVMPRERAKLEWYRFYTRAKDVVSIIIYWWTCSKPRPNLALLHKARAAKALHTQMYSAFARGDVETLKEICTDGILSKFTARVAQRAPSEKMIWTLHKHTKSPRVVAHRAAPLPGADGAGIRQAIVRLESQQSLVLASNDRHDASPNIQAKTEYLVLQKRMWEKAEGPWMVWGTVYESDWKKAIL